MSTQKKNWLTKTLLACLMMVCLASAASAALTDDIRFWYSLDDVHVSGKLVLDNSTARNNGTNFDATTGEVGVLRESYFFDGSGEYIIANGTNVFSNNWTYCAWVNFDLNDTNYAMARRAASNNIHVMFGSQSAGSAYFALYDGAGSACGAIEVAGSKLGDNTWHHICGRVHPSNMSYWLDGAIIGTDLTLGCNPTAEDQQTRIGGRSQDTYGDVTGHLDEAGLWSRPLTDTEITTLYNGGSGYNPFTPAAAPASSTIDILVMNETGNYLTEISEGEDINYQVNWTDDADNSAINATSGGACNITVFDAIREHESNEPAFTLCGVSCDYEYFSENFTGLTVGAQRDLIHFDACHEQLAQADITVYVNGSSCSYTSTISASQLPLCSAGNATLFLNTTACVSSTWANVSIEYTGTNNKRKTISDIHYDREFASITEAAVFDAATQLWNGTSWWEYYDHGSKTAWSNCTHSAESGYDNSVTESHNVKDEPPVVVFSQVNTSLGVTALTAGVNIEFASGVWNWAGAILDDDAQHLNVSWRNSSGHILYSVTGSPTTTVLNTADGLFLDFANPYSINVTVNDSGGNVVNESLIFLVNDTVLPTVTITSPANNSQHTLGVFLNFSASCTDEGLYWANWTVRESSGNISLSNASTAISGTSWSDFRTVNTSTMGADNYTINMTCKDYHTNTLLKENPVIEKPALNLMQFDLTQGTVSIEVEHKGDLTDFSYEKLSDRYVFDITTMSDRTEYIFKVYAHKMEEVPNSPYPCHLVLNDNYWWDAQIDGMASCKLTRRSGYYEAKVTMGAPSKTVRTNSLGELNVQTAITNFELRTFRVFTGVNWTGITCGEKYPDNSFNLSFAGQALSNCSLHVNDYLYDGWATDCTNISTTLNIGRNRFVLDAQLSNATWVESECTIWNDKQNKEIGDYIWFFIVMALVALFMFLGSVYAIGLTVAGFLLLWLGYHFFAYSWVLGTFGVLVGLVMMIWSWLK